MHEILAISAPNRQIHRRKGQTCTHVYRPDNGDPTHRLMVANFEFLFVRLIANLTEGHLPAGNRVANANLLIRGSLVIPIFVKNPRFNIFSKNCEENASKSEPFSSRPLFPQRFGISQNFEGIA
jgi:hypothetical protein